ncbi:MAG TPA: IgA Peptidase M64 [Candidatus Bacteroides merdipullorum]|uniref:IgA Peptidase M64 n=1 Tax=Candidatus Bacteroides merdipullorum TaxID=2838474 RepID=A0A9D2A6L2_9BACE|nr:IgA Peptidase M64 [Candidatus Bacteroides merdipullorum]
MKKRHLLLACLCLCLAIAKAQTFEQYFTDRTLRVDYLFTGNAEGQAICVDELSALPRWAGRRHHLSELPLAGNGQITMKDAADGTVIYRTSFSALFQEWLETDEARTTTKGFENTFLLPFPRRTAEVEVTLFDSHRQIRARLQHRVDPNDILIRRKGEAHVCPHRYLLKNGPTDRCIDVAIVAEGYTEGEMDVFYRDAQTACESLFDHEPFRSMKKRFNIVAVASPSADSGVSIPRLGEWRSTAFGSHFSTFYSDRYLTTSHLKTLHDALAGIDYEHIIVLANTDEYGGGGIYNSYTLTTAHHKDFRPVVVHEFGHSFGGLADEYFYDEDVMNDTYPTDVEPWEQNVTTHVDFASKWQDLIPEGTPLPTPADNFNMHEVGLYEGAAYSARGLYRASYNCRMRTNEYPAFCPVCQRALRRLIEFYTE